LDVMKEEAAALAELDTLADSGNDLAALTEDVEEAAEKLDVRKTSFIPPFILLNVPFLTELS